MLSEFICFIHSAVMSLIGSAVAFLRFSYNIAAYIAAAAVSRIAR